jgi:hypothetical protein
MDFSANSMMVSLVAGIIGLGLFRYGKKEERLPHLFGGVALMVYPMFFSGAGSMLAVGAGIAAAIAIAIGAGY